MATLRVAPKPAAEPMKVAQISKPGGDFEIVERDIPEPDAGQVRIKVQACGVCHTATCSPRKDYGLESNSRASLGTKSSARSMRLAKMYPRGGMQGNASGYQSSITHVPAGCSMPSSAHTSSCGRPSTIVAPSPAISGAAGKSPILAK